MQNGAQRQESESKMRDPYMVRFKFSKVGKLQFISHLDLQRTMKSALIRAKIPLWYTEGFNPHPKMVFALPLSIGVESQCELMDIKITDDVDLEELRKALDNQTTAEMRIEKCYIPSKKFSDLCFAEYIITFSDNIESAKDTFNGECVVLKKSKSGETEVDISPLIKSISYEGNVVRAVLESNSERFLNPDYVSNVIAEKTNTTVISTMRTKIFEQDGITEFI